MRFIGDTFVVQTNVSPIGSEMLGEFKLTGLLSERSTQERELTNPSLGHSVPLPHGHGSVTD
jgi:hypothetical protein